MTGMFRSTCPPSFFGPAVGRHATSLGNQSKYNAWGHRAFANRVTGSLVHLLRGSGLVDCFLSPTEYAGPTNSATPITWSHIVQLPGFDQCQPRDGGCFLWLGVHPFHPTQDSRQCVWHVLCVRFLLSCLFVLGSRNIKVEGRSGFLPAGVCYDVMVWPVNVEAFRSSGVRISCS